MKSDKWYASLQDAVNDKFATVQKDEFLSVVKDAFGLIESANGAHLVGIDETKSFGETCINPVYAKESMGYDYIFTNDFYWNVDSLKNPDGGLDIVVTKDSLVLRAYSRNTSVVISGYSYDLLDLFETRKIIIKKESPCKEEHS